ncbi:hypothetical protein ACT453_59845, partial [Bacillus sp. D-CC]
WKIELGNKPTDWIPAPEDQVTTTDFTKKTVEIETTIKGINTTVSNVQNEQGKLTCCLLYIRNRLFRTFHSRFNRI